MLLPSSIFQIFKLFSPKTNKLILLFELLLINNNNIIRNQ